MESKPLVPKLRFPEFRETGDWEEVQLNRFSHFINDRVGDAECVPYSVTSGEGLVSQDKKFGRTIAGNSLSSYIRLVPNDFAYNKSSTKLYPEGYVARFRDDVKAAVPKSIFTCFRVDRDKVEPAYLDYLFAVNLHGRWLRRFLSIGARAHGSLNVNDSDLMALPVPLPSGENSRAEQKKIADCLTSLDELIAAEGRKLEALRTYKKGLMQNLFPREGETTPRLRFPEFQDAGGWQEKRLAELTNSISNGISLPQHDNATGVKVTRIETIADESINLCKVGYVTPVMDLSASRLEVGDILFSNINSVAHIGKSVLVERDYDLYHGMNLLRLRVRQAEHSARFVQLSISTTQMRDFFRTRANKAVNQASINQTELGLTTIPVPPLAEQQQIANCLASLDSLITSQAKKLGTLKIHKQGLMQGLFPSLDEVAA